MGLVQIFVIWGAASAALFSFPSLAQETVTKGNQVSPHQPPLWFSRMSRPESIYPAEIDHFTVAPAEVLKTVSVWGIPHIVKPKIACRVDDGVGGKKWAFCDL